MKKTILCLSAVVFSYGCFLPAVYAVDCLTNKAGEPILNSPPNCTPQSQTEQSKNQPATDAEPSLDELRKIAETATDTREQLEEDYEEEKALYEEMRSLGADEESLNLLKTDLEYKQKALKEAEEQESEAWKIAREEGREQSHINRKDFLNELEEKRKKIAGQTVSLPEMGITLGSDITTTDSLFANVIKFLSRGIGIVAVLSIMVGGVILTVSSADEDLQTKAKDIILYSLLAIVFVLGAYAIVSGIQQIIYSLGK